MALFVTAATIAAEIGIQPRTVLQHARALERSGVPVIARIGRPTQINRAVFMREMFPGWREEGETWSNSAD